MPKNLRVPESYGHGNSAIPALSCKQALAGRHRNDMLHVCIGRHSSKHLCMVLVQQHWAMNNHVHAYAHMWPPSCPTIRNTLRPTISPPDYVSSATLGALRRAAARARPTQQGSAARTFLTAISPTFDRPAHTQLLHLQQVWVGNRMPCKGPSSKQAIAITL